MGVWSFRWKSIRSRRASRGGASNSRSEDSTMHNAGTLRNPGRHDGSELNPILVPERRRSRKDTQRRRISSKDSKKLQKSERQRAYSFSPGRNDSIRVSRGARDAHRPPVPPIPENLGAKPKEGETTVGAPVQEVETSGSWYRMPTLHKRSAQELSGRKLSKKRKEDHNREQEIKAMVSFTPLRPAVDAVSSGRPLKRDSKKMRTGLNRAFSNPHSDISLPSAESMHSSVSSNSDYQTSYKVSALDVLAPRPTIRYSENPRYAPGASGFGSDRSGSQMRRISDRIHIPEEVLKANKRIDDLADDLDARELRELMERDTKRREKKKMNEKAKMEKRLARRQEKQRAEETVAARDGTPSPDNMDRGVMGREVVGLGIGTSAVTTSSKRRGSGTWDSGRGKRPADVFHKDPSPHERSQPINIPQDVLNKPEPILEPVQAGSIGRPNPSPPASPRNILRSQRSISQMMDLDTPRTPSPPKGRTAEPIKQTAGPKPPSSWTSFFRRNKRASQTSTSSFSNTSRETVQNAPHPPAGYTPIVRQTSNVPKRTMSKFREDLPELPLSPPDSRVQSPEADVVPPIQTNYIEKRSSHRRSLEEHRRHDTPISTMRLRDGTPTSGHRSTEVPSPEPPMLLSQSLASIDSEASWLSGRKAGSKRGSMQTALPPLRDSASSLQQRYKELSESTEELGIAEDEYFSRLTPGPFEENMIKRTSTGFPMPSSDEEDGNTHDTAEKTKWGAVARHPTVVHREPRAKSDEGLYDLSNSENAGETPTSLNRETYGFHAEIENVDEDETSLSRATSVDYGKSGHARQVSAGSAKLLDLKRGASQEKRRPSLS